MHNISCRVLCQYYKTQAKNAPDYISIDWNALTEYDPRHKKRKNCADLSLKLGRLTQSSRPMFTIMNQASFGQVLQTCPDAISKPWHKMIVFDSRLSALFYKARGLTPYQPTMMIPFPLYSNTKAVATSLPPISAKKRRVFISTGTVSHNRCRTTLASLSNTGHMSSSTWSEMVSDSEFVVMCGGTFPATFMLYETILKGSIPVFIVPYTTHLWNNANGRVVHSKKQRTPPLYECMPFADDGVDWARFSIVEAERHLNVSRLVQSLYTMDRSKVARMQHELEAVRHRFLPKAAFAYARRRTPSHFS